MHVVLAVSGGILWRVFIPRGRLAR